MASRINVYVVNERGEHVSQMNLKVEYGGETQTVLIVLKDPDSDFEVHPYREALNDCMTEQLAMQEGYDA